MSKHTWYLAGPMTGIPQFNFPAFFAAAKALREVHGLTIVSPAELDDADTQKAAMKSPDGVVPSNGTVGAHTWGDFLSRDVKLIADECTGIVLLPGWEKSRGARLEAFVGILCGHDFALYEVGTGLIQVPAEYVLTDLYRHTRKGITHVTD